MNLYLDLFLTFARVGVLTFGGGMAMLPILQREIVEHKHWISEGELTDCFAIGQCTPGIIAVNTATFVGFKQARNLGGIAATLGIVAPSILIIGIIAAFLQQFTEIAWVTHAFAGIRACVCALIFSSVLKLLKSAVVDAPTVFIYCGVLLASVLWGLSPVVMVLCAGVLGLMIRGVRYLIARYQGGRES